MRRVTAGVALVACASASLLLSAVTSPTVASAAPSKSLTKEISRIHLIDGKDVVADKRTFSVTVGTTTALRDRQAVRVSWTGARPSTHVNANPNSESASNQEFPVVLLQCRGVDSNTVAPGQRVRPETCWTQTPSDHFFTSDARYPPWRVDRYATAMQRAANVGRPDPLPAKCRNTGYQERWLHFVGVSGVDYAGGLGGCGGVPAESAAVDSKLGLPPNSTFAKTEADGTGAAKFIPWTSQTNASLGCTDKIACSLVIIPIEGVSCDVGAASLPADQQPTGDDADVATEQCQAPGGATDARGTNSGKLWWTSSNWRNRISVPLSFNPLPPDCAASNSSAAIIYGSELLTQATQSWSFALCGNSKQAPLRHVQVGEPQARSLIANRTVSAAFTSQPPTGSDSPAHVLAPTSLTGFAISYIIDDKSGHEYLDLKLTPRLLAKLMTMSYPGVFAEKQENVGIKGNPLEMSQDPEFHLLNPTIKKGVDSGIGAASLYLLSSNSDVVAALTAYINADSEARAWLDGKADAWGMSVNPAYKGIALPVDSWPLLDTVMPPGIYNENNPCLQANPVPFLPLLAAPSQRLATISQSVQFAISPSQIVCTLPPTGDTAGAKLTALGRQTIGSRFLIGLTSLGDAGRYDLDTAALQTKVSPDALGDFTSLTGRSFVAPSRASLRAAGGLLKPDVSAGTWRFEYSDVVGGGGSTTAYPGTMLVSTLVPTVGLQPAVATRLATFLRFVVNGAQIPGQEPGRLPKGYEPLSASNGFAAEAAYTTRAANAVAAQLGEVPPLVAVPVAPTAAPTAPAAPRSPKGATSGTTGTSGTTPSSGTAFVAPGGTTAGGPSTGRPPAPQPTVALPARELPVVTASVRTRSSGSSVAGVFLLLLVAGAVVTSTAYGRLSLRARRAAG